MKTKAQSEVHQAISLDDLAKAVSDLSSRELEEIELAFSPDEEKEILKRKKVRKSSSSKKGVELAHLQEEFG